MARQQIKWEKSPAAGLAGQPAQDLRQPQRYACVFNRRSRPDFVTSAKTFGAPMHREGCALPQ